ncbi:MAG TPA: V-type ATP synthase subunit F [Candidatus Merdibacter merdavium]|uniref:V-type ATP synthase subunit F n=1 Tax=Candidatus Merdibacter merdavium TaxID=2838692 RepID=A0A9D2NUX2_9FIRM|nr:V-type ATP synthase subunit F [Merdibacter sp.]HIY89814.1 V-type ATP synthase subunit F [Candidatus Merdibacter merdipullorum]HJC37188.1 V-type ATP synthase subunit F [Candidatus Merdibacter merdavium]
MKFFLISDNIDTQMGMRLAGIEGVVVHERQEVLEVLEKVLHREDVAVILMTTRLVETCPEVISELKLKLKKPLIEEIPDRHGSAKIGETIDRYVSEAIGVKL